MKKFIVFLLVYSCSAAVTAQVFFEKSYTNVFRIASSHETSGGGFIVSASSTGYSTTASDLLMMKTDATGTTQWIKTYGNANDDETGDEAIETLDGGYLLGGTSNNQHAFLVKTNAAGVTQWQFKYDLGGGCGIQDMHALPDSSFLVIFGATNTTYYPGFCRIDKNGVILWIKQFTNINTGNSLLKTIIPLSNGDFIGVGRISMGSGTFHEFLFRFDASGNITWTKRFSGGFFYDGIQTSDGNLVIVGYSNSATILAKIDINANVLWRKSYTNSLVDIRGHSVAENASGQLILMTKPVSFNTSNPIIAIKTDAAGAVLFSCQFTNFSYQHPSNFQDNSTLRPTSDGGFIWGQEGYLKKITPDLSSTCGITPVTVTGVTASSVDYIYSYSLQNYSSPLSAGFIEIPLSTTTTTNCSTILLSASSAQNNPMCSGQCTGTATVTAAGGQGPYTYAWMPGGQTTPTVSSLCAGTYSVTVTDANSAQVTVTVSITAPPALTGSATATTPALCGSGCTNLDVTATGGTPGYTYLWMPGSISGSTPNVCPVATTSYTCTITDANACTQTAGVTVTVNPLPVASAGSNNTVCEGSTVCFAGSGGITYQWAGPCNFSGTQQNPCVTAGVGCSGTYTVTVTDTSGCSGSATTTLTVNPLPVVSYVQSPTVVCINWNPVTLSPGTPAGGTYTGPGVSGNTFDPVAAGSGLWDIVYTYTDSNGCGDSAVQQVTVDLCTGIAGTGGANELSVYPNPCNETVTVVSGEPGTLQLYNLPGDLLLETKLLQNRTTLNLDGIATGVYFIRIINGTTVRTQKIYKL